MRPPKLAIRMAAGGIAVAATLALGVAGASAAPNPGPGYSGALAHGTGPAAPAPTDVSPNVSAVVDGPQTANVPTLAWAGEAVRLVACDPYIFPGSKANDTPYQTAEWSTENWTGDQADADIPTLDGQQGNVPLSFTQGSNGFFCAERSPRTPARAA